MFFLILIWLGNIVTGQVQGCEKDVQKIFARTGGVASFNFFVGNYINLAQVTFSLRNPSHAVIAQMIYTRATNQTDIQTLPNVTLQVNSNWEIQIDKYGVVTNDKGLYIMSSQLTLSFCSFLYIFGKPQKPVLSQDKNNILGRNSQLSCSSSSTTYPANHSLYFNYSWEVNDIKNPLNQRYMYGSSRKTLTLLSVIKDDANKRFKCIATESRDGVIGLTSDNSDEFVFRVIYGPDVNTTTLSPPNTEYTLNEGARLNDIMCVGDCYPSCNFKWTKSGTNGASEFSNNAVLSLGTLSRVEAATYTCDVTNANTTVRTVRKQIVVNVNYGPDASTTKLIPSSVTYTHNEGDSINDIQCSGNCYPSCNFKWTKSGSDTSFNNATLSLGSLNRTEAGTCTCTVSNPTTGKKQTKTVSIFVRYGPDIGSTTLTPASTSYTLVENTYLDDIVCEADCYPECQYKWTKPDNTVVSNNGVLSLGALNRNEATNYTFTVTRFQTTVSVRKQVSVSVIYGPDAGSVILDPVKGTYTENEGPRLNDITCSTVCYPTCSYKWTKSGTNALVSNTDVLTLATLNRDKAATYTCTASNQRTSSTATAEVIVHVRYGPDACTINSISPLTLTEGESSPTVSCESECFPSCSHTWSNMSSSSPIGNNGKFQLVKATRYQAGSYKCFCRNKATVQYVKNQTAILQIIIQYPPIVTVLLSTEDLSEGNELTVSCDANGFPSVYSYNGLTQTWKGAPVPNTHTEISGSPKHSTLYIPSLQLQDTGTYTCYVNNGVKSADTVSSVIVKVKVLPKIFTRLSMITGRIGGTISISVHFYSYPDIQEVILERYDHLLIRNDTSKKYIVSHDESIVHDKFYGKDVSLSGMQANLVISNLKEEDFGSYTLILKNKLGKTITPFTIDAQSPPSGVFNISIDNIQQNTARVSWTPGYHGGFAQTFLIQLSTDREHWKNEETIYGGIDESEEPMHETLNNLQESTTFYVRMYAFNREGNSPFSEVHNFTTLTTTEVQINSAAVIAGAVGGSISALVIIAVILVVVVLVRRKIITKDSIRTRIQTAFRNKQKEPKPETEGQDNSIMMYEQLKHTTNSEQTNVYDALKVDPQATDNSTVQYENLPKDSTSPTYMNISAASKGKKKANRTYENLNLHSKPTG